MEENLTELLYRSAALTFERLTFMFTDSDLEEMQLRAPFEAAARVAFSGPLQGVMVISVYGGILAKLTSNMLAELEASDRDLYPDALKEIANVICGNLLSALGDSESDFDLQPPETGWADLESEASARVCVGLEDGRAELALYLLGEA